MLDCCCLKRYLSRRRYYLYVWFPVESASPRWVWAASLWITAGEGACLFQKLLLLVNLQSFKILFHWLLTIRTPKNVTIHTLILETNRYPVILVKKKVIYAAFLECKILLIFFMIFKNLNSIIFLTLTHWNLDLFPFLIYVSKQLHMALIFI